MGTTESLEITVAATENALHIFEVDGVEASNGAPWDELPKVQLHADPEDTLRDVLERASVELGIRVSRQTKQTTARFREERGEEPREEGVVDRLAFAEFRRPDDDEVVNEHGTIRRLSRLGSTSVAAVRDEMGCVVWKRPPFEATMAELIDAAEAGLIEGDPLQPYLVLVIPQGGFGLFAEWQRFLDTLNLLWEVSGAMAQAGGAWAFLDMVRRVFRRRSDDATEVVERNALAWSERGAGPDDLIELLRQKPRTGAEIASLLGCTDREAEAVLWGLGCTESEGLWRWRGDPVASFIADDLELRPMLENYRGKDTVRQEFERRLRELGENGRSPSSEQEKQKMHEEFSKRIHAEIEEELGPPDD